ncbi:HK97 family phage prohead protease [Gemmata sp.]|uniref:HK97 family phage prohead protease n=1 Tax=Gemmata sp. TaxID=1914242 RepID=UPI003F714D73
MAIPFRVAGARAAITAAPDGAKLATFTGVAYTGAPMQPGGWYGQIILDLDGIVVPKQQRPALRQHDHEKIVGHTTAVKVTPDGIKVTGVFSGQDSPHAREIIALAKNGFEWQMSVGANPLRTEFLESGETTTVNGREITGPITISRETELGEVSFVPLGADGDTSADVTAAGAATAVKARPAPPRKSDPDPDETDEPEESDEEDDDLTDEEHAAALAVEATISEETAARIEKFRRETAEEIRRGTYRC